MNAIIVKYCAGVTSISIQQSISISKPLFQPGVVVSTINALRREHCIELMDFTHFLIKICSGNINVHQKMNSEPVIQFNTYF